MSQSQRVSLQSAFVLHKRPYSESSLLLDVFSCDYGKVALLAKGARRNRSRLAGILEPFVPLSLSWSGKSDLQLLTGAEAIPPGIQLIGHNLYCGLYLNELLNHFLHRHDAHQNLFSHYTSALVALSGQGEAEMALRYFELALLEEVGFGLQIERDAKRGEPIYADRRYEYRIGFGLVESNDSQGGIAGSTLIHLARRNLEGRVQLAESKRMMRTIIDHHLAGKVLRSRALFMMQSARKQRSD
ncbi:MAG: DNA repair protein RecO [Methylococcales bacterium]